ncbi:MAG: cupin domain-containing protein [Candidatus Hydrogenedentota bacterium]
MPILNPAPTVIEAAGTKPKIIQEFIGYVNSKNDSLSIARMQSPQGWEEPGQRPEFDEYTVVLIGALHIETEGGETLVVSAGQAITVNKGEWIRYSTPGEDGAEYIAVCLPAFSPDTVHRDEDCR